MADQILDLRMLADEWNDKLEELSEENPSWGEMADAVGGYESLCRDLGIDATPDDLKYYGDSYEPTLIREDYFTEYAQELAEDICPWPSGSSERDALAWWPYRHIDWEAAADELKYDYTTVEYDGDTYYIRRSC